MKTKAEIVLNALFNKIPVKLNNRIYVLLDNKIYTMVGKYDFKTKKKSVEYFKDSLPLDYFIKASENLSDADVTNIVFNLVEVQRYLERHKKLPDMWNYEKYEQEILDSMGD